MCYITGAGAGPCGVGTSSLAAALAGGGVNKTYITKIYVIYSGLHYIT